MKRTFVMKKAAILCLLLCPGVAALSAGDPERREDDRPVIRLPPVTISANVEHVMIPVNQLAAMSGFVDAHFSTFRFTDVSFQIYRAYKGQTELQVCLRDQDGRPTRWVPKSDLPLNLKRLSPALFLSGNLGADHCGAVVYIVFLPEAGTFTIGRAKKIFQEFSEFAGLSVQAAARHYGAKDLTEFDPLRHTITPDELVCVLADEASAARFVAAHSGDRVGRSVRLNAKQLLSEANSRGSGTPEEPLLHAYPWHSGMALPTVAEQGVPFSVGWVDYRAGIFSGKRREIIAIAPYLP